MSKFRDGGIIEKLKSKWWKENLCKDNENNASYKPLGFVEVFVCYYFRYQLEIIIFLQSLNCCIKYP